jgi:hypothetical protein
MSAYIFLCNERTEQECYDRQLFGTNSADYFKKFFSKIDINDDIFLYNYEMEYLKGPFKALTICSARIINEAWSKQFPYQVQVQSFAYENPIFKVELSQVINFNYGKHPPAQITNEEGQSLKLALQKRNANKIIDFVDSNLSNYWIFKCDKTTGGRVFNENIVGAPIELFKDIVSKVQEGDTIFVWQIEEQKLFGLWKAKKRGYYDDKAFPETDGRINAVVQCDRAYNLDKGLNYLTLEKLKVAFSKNKMPFYQLDEQKGKSIEEELFKINQSLEIESECSTIPGKYLTDDGHWVRSQGELIIDNWLYRNGIIHAYEHRIQRGRDFKKSDFYLQQYDLVIEYWGLAGNDKYEISKRDKINFYNSNKVKFLELYPQDIYMLSEVLKSKLSNYGIDTK